MLIWKYHIPPWNTLKMIENTVGEPLVGDAIILQTTKTKQKYIIEVNSSLRSGRFQGHTKIPILFFFIITQPTNKKINF